MSTCTSFPALSHLAVLHRDLEELFLQHQEALLVLDLPLAAERLGRYAEVLRRHMAAEEEVLLPLLPRAGRIRGAAPELFTGEHERLLALLARARALLEALDPAAPDVRRRVLELLDAEGTLKHLEHHHHLREETLLVPALEQVTDAPEREALLAAFAARAGL
jgi:hemerythrin-like domain-containing protein